MNHTDFHRAFQSGTIFEDREYGQMVVYHIHAGDVVLPTGRVIACDPSYLQWPDELTPFTRSCPPGRYPVILAVINYVIPETTADRVACAMIRFKSTEAIHWEMALLPDQDPTTLPLGRFYGYGVDAGLGSFLDADVVEQLTDDRAETLYRDRLLPALGERAPHCSWAQVMLDSGTNANIVFFSSGYGDGSYPSYWGVDATQEVCCLVTDFQILVEPIEGEVHVPLQDWLERPIEHPDIEQLAIEIRVRLPDSRSKQVQIEMRGENADSCDALITNHTNVYHAHQHQVVNEVYTATFTLEEPLQPDATLTLHYTMGIRAL